jgi:hypothetical protein
MAACTAGTPCQSCMCPSPPRTASWRLPATATERRGAHAAAHAAGGAPAGSRRLSRLAQAKTPFPLLRAPLCACVPTVYDALCVASFNPLHCFHICFLLQGAASRWPPIQHPEPASRWPPRRSPTAHESGWRRMDAPGPQGLEWCPATREARVGAGEASHARKHETCHPARPSILSSPSSPNPTAPQPSRTPPGGSQQRTAARWQSSSSQPAAAPPAGRWPPPGGQQQQCGRRGCPLAAPPLRQAFSRWQPAAPRSPPQVSTVARLKLGSDVTAGEAGGSGGDDGCA